MRLKSRKFLAFTTTLLLGAVLGACEEDPVDPGPPGAPSGLAGTPSETSVTLTWNQVPDASSYEVDRAQGSGSFSTVGSGVTETTFEDTGLEEDTEYRYVVRAVRGGEESNNSNEVTVSTAASGPKVATLTGVSQDRTLYSDTTYVLSGYVKVSNGATLTIEPGTVIQGDTLVPGSSLWVLRGSRIEADGTADEPIVFTSQRAFENRRPGDWGGIVIVGNAPINRTANPIFTEGPTGAAENYAGGTNFDDDSGSLRYVRVEFAGYDISNGNGQELNSISSYAVGRGTTYDYVQSVAGLDDSFEFWGGGVDIRHMISFEAGDDHFDWSEGYQGRGQYLIALQTSVIQPRTGTGSVSGDPRGFEGDGCENDKAGCASFANQPHSIPAFTNFTLIGPGTGVFSTTDGSGAVVRRGSGGMFVNGIIGRWPGTGVSIRDAESGALMDVDSLYFRNIILAENGSNFESSSSSDRFGSRLETNAPAWNIQEAELADIFGTLPGSTTAVTDANLNLQPTAGSAAATGGLVSLSSTPLAAKGGSFFGADLAGTAYVGAVDPTGTPWYSGWTSFDRN